MRVQPRERFSSEVVLTPAWVAEQARAAGDTNPIHHDPAFAASSRYGRLIASGTHTTALLLGLTASHFSKHGSMVGLEFWVRFRRPIFADETVKLEWLVVKVTPNTRLGGEVVELRGPAVADMQRTLAVLPGVEKVESEDGVLRLFVRTAADALALIAGPLRAAGSDLESLEVHRVSLERVFMHLTGKALRD